jgi:biopolymer transport protein ExbD
MQVSGFEDYLSLIPEGSRPEFQLHIDPHATVGIVYDITKLMYKSNHSGKPHPNIKFMNLEVDDSEAIRLEGYSVTLEELRHQLAEGAPDRYLAISFYVDDNVSPDFIRSIEQVMRETGIRRVNYHTR